MITPINNGPIEQGSQNIWIKIGQKPMLALVSELCSILYNEMYDELQKAEYVDIADNIVPAGTHPDVLKNIRRQICKYGFTGDYISRYDCFAGIIIPHIKRGGSIELISSPLHIMINATEKTSISKIVQILSHFYMDKEDSELVGKMVNYSDKIHQQTKYDIGSNFHTILMAAKFLMKFSIRIVSPTNETVAVIDVSALRRDIKNQYKAMKT